MSALVGFLGLGGQSFEFQWKYLITLLLRRLGVVEHQEKQEDCGQTCDSGSQHLQDEDISSCSIAMLRFISF